MINVFWFKKVTYCVHETVLLSSVTIITVYITGKRIIAMRGIVYIRYHPYGWGREKCGPADLRTDGRVNCGPKVADRKCGRVSKMRTLMLRTCVCGPKRNE